MFKYVTDNHFRNPFLKTLSFSKKEAELSGPPAMFKYSTESGEEKYVIAFRFRSSTFPLQMPMNGLIHRRTLTSVPEASGQNHDYPGSGRGSDELDGSREILQSVSSVYRKVCAPNERTLSPSRRVTASQSGFTLVSILCV